VDQRQKKGVEVFNRDIDPSEDFAAAFPNLRPLIINTLISSAFAERETAAARLKRLYVRLGSVGLICVFVVMMSSAYQFTLGNMYGFPRGLTWACACVAAIGLGSQLVLVFGGVKERWRVQRFVAERLRCLKFQLFTEIAVAPSAEALKLRVESETRERIARLNQEAMAGRAAILRFNPPEVFIPTYQSQIQINSELLDDAWTVYDTLRLELQIEHFEGQRSIDEKLVRTPASISQLTFGAGALLAIWQIAAVVGSNSFGLGPIYMASPLVAWSGFLSLTLFIVSAVVAVYERGSSHQSNAERYMNYAREARHVRMLAMRDKPENFMVTVVEMEKLALRELFDFCRDTDRSNFII
jgi:hypothetical protein